MAETGRRSSQSPIIDYKKASAKDVQKTLVEVTGQEKWGNANNWKFYLKSRNTIFNNIARSSEFGGLDWRDPDSWEPLENAYISQSKREAKLKPAEGEIPQWALDGDWMDRYPEIIQWMRKEHWRNNTAKLKELKKLFDDGSQKLEQIASGETAQGSAVGEAGDTDSGLKWQDVMLQR